METITNQTAFDFIQSAIVNKQNKAFGGIVTEMVIAKGDGMQFNEEYCKQNHIELLPYPNSGGCIVIFPDDIICGLLTQDATSTFAVDFLNAFAEWLETKDITAQFVGNDVLVDGTYKVASGSIKGFNSDFAYVPIHISMQVDLDLIRNICQKPMVKIPKGLSEYGLTSQEVLEFCTDFIDNYNKVIN